MDPETSTPDAFLPLHWQRTCTELERTVARYHGLERLALVVTAAIWTVLAATTSVDWDPIVKWLPCVLNLFCAARAFVLVRRIGVLERVLAAAEQRFAVPPELALETQRGARRVGRFTAFAFWLGLLAATAVLPWFYIEQASDPGYQTDTSVT